MVYAQESPILHTPFDISFSETNFTISGYLHQVLIIKPNGTATIQIKVSNHDAILHNVSLSIPSSENVLEFLESYSFEPPTILIQPNSEQQVLLHIKAQNNSDVDEGKITVLAQGESFGIIGKYFYLVIGDENNSTGLDLSGVDYISREGVPSTGPPDLYDNYLTNATDLQKFFDAKTKIKFNVPKYLPAGYAFQGVYVGSESTQFVYTSTKITNSAESIGSSNPGGMTILYQTDTPDFDPAKWMLSYIAQNEGQQIMINGMGGVTTDQLKMITREGIKVKGPAQVILFKDGINVELRGDMALDELLKVAASIPLNNDTSSSNANNFGILPTFVLYIILAALIIVGVVTGILWNKSRIKNVRMN